jgi:hypothetical protein
METAQIHLGLQPLTRQNLNAEIVDAYATTSVGQIPSLRSKEQILTLRFFSSRCAGDFSALSGAEWRQFYYEI